MRSICRGITVRGAGQAVREVVLRPLKGHREVLNEQSIAPTLRRGHSCVGNPVHNAWDLRSGPRWNTDATGSTVSTDSAHRDGTTHASRKTAGGVDSEN